MISVVLATHNEEKNLARCLQSVRSFADEIILADGESTDNTLTIAKKFGAKIIATTNKLNFHINKQLAMDAAHGHLILQIDADEVVDEELAAFITAIHDGQLPEHDRYNAWWLKRKNLFLGTFLTKGGQDPDPVIRLYRQGKARLPQTDVHEQMRVDGESGWADGHLIHYSNPTFDDYLRKFNTYTSLKAVQLNEAHVKANLWQGFLYMIVKPVSTFVSIYLRHRGLVDGIPGFVFAAMSGTHHAVAYLKLWELQEKKKYAK